ncbi:hypothetical protein CsSME_00043334 [Camellia sinensis var. sinensis]
MVRYTWFTERFRGTEPETIEETEWNAVGLYLLSALVTLPRVRFYDWGGGSLTTLYEYMSSTSRLRGNLIGSYWGAWEVHISILSLHFAGLDARGDPGAVCRCLGHLLLPYFA